MATFKQYEKKDGTKAWMFKAYLGTDPNTGKRLNPTKRGFSSKKEAKLALTRLQADFDNGELFKNDIEEIQQKKTFQEVFDLWKQNYELTVKESTFVKAMTQFENHVLPVFGPKVIDEITISDVQQFANENVNKFVKYRDFVTDVARVLEYAISLELIDSNPAKRITIPKRKADLKEKRMNYYTKDELKKFLDYSKKQQPFYIYTFFKLLSASGCRQGELLGLEWRSVDFENKCIHIRQTLARGKNKRLYLETPKTKHSNRSVALDDQTLAILKRWRVEQKALMLQFGHNTLEPNQLVFSGQESNSFIQLSKPRTWMLQTINKNKLREITIHGFRHTHATLLLEAGVSPKVISERLGHSSIQVTLDLYSHVTKKMEKEVPNVFAKVMSD